MSEEKSLLEFPCEFPIKAMGRCNTGFEAKALGIVQRHVPGFDTDSMKVVASQKGNYLSATFTIQAASQGQLDNIYHGLTACEEILMVF